MTEPDVEIWMVDLDGTGSMHSASKGDPGAVGYTRTDTLPTWQPIESAPKDGTPILTFSDECEVLEAFLVCWWSEAKAEKSGFGWCAYEVDHALCPDLWMPLPTPPKGDTHD